MRWSVAGGSGTAGTGITQDGLLIVGASESATTLTVSAASTVYANLSGTGSVTLSALPSDPAYPFVCIRGNPYVGGVLAADVSALGSVPLSFQWKRAEAVNESGTVIAGASGNYYIPAEADYNKWISVTVTRAGTPSSVTSPAVGPVLRDGRALELPVV